MSAKAVIDADHDWSVYESHDAIHRALGAAWPVPPATVIAGPIRRLLEMAVAAAPYRGDQARIVEHARHWRERALSGIQGAEAADLRSAADNLASAILAAGPNRWLIEIFCGRAGHHDL
jgi:hypothetical protein